MAVEAGSRGAGLGTVARRRLRRHSRPGSSMASSRLSTKGQLVVPVEIRRYLGLRTGDRIDFVVGEDGSVTLRPARLQVRDLEGMLAHDGPVQPVSIERMKEAVRAAHGPQ